MYATPYTIFKKKLLTKNHAPISGPCEIASFSIPNTLYFLHFCIRVRPFEGRATQAQPIHQICQKSGIKFARKERAAAGGRKKFREWTERKEKSHFFSP